MEYEVGKTFESERFGFIQFKDPSAPDAAYAVSGHRKTKGTFKKTSASRRHDDHLD